MSPQTDVLQDAIALNNQGCKSLMMGDLRSASSDLTDALQASKRLIESSEDDMDISVTDNEISVPSLQILNLDDIMVQVVSKGFESQRVVYGYPIMLPSHLALANTSKNVSTLSAAIIFNMALTFHKLALTQEGSKRAQFLSKAVKLYEFGASLKENMVWSNFLHLAILNNLGLAHELLGNKQQAEQCFQQLLSCILYIIDCRQGGVSALEIFFQNTMHIIFPGCDLNGAAAAA